MKDLGEGKKNKNKGPVSKKAKPLLALLWYLITCNKGR